MRVKAWLYLLSCLLVTGSTLAKGDFDACKVITRSEIEAVQGEPVLDTKSSERKTGGFAIAQCYYTLPSHTKSVSLEVTRPDPEQSAPSGPRDRWKKMFHDGAGREGEREEEKESGKPLPVSGIGDEAFWSGNAMVGALYVLKDNSYFRISIGGAEDASVKIRKTKALAQKALKRLPNSSSLSGAPGLGPLRAEEAGPASTDSYSEHIQVTATRIPQKTGTTPASVTVITGEDLVRRGAYDLRSALALAAGIDVAPGGDGGPASSVPEFWGLREFDAFLLAVDSVPSGGAFNPALTTLDLTDVDRIEILRGAAPVMFGATSFVGVINVIHRSPGEGGAALRTAGGSYGSASLAWHSPLPQWLRNDSSLSVDAARQGFSDERTEFDRGHVRWQNSRIAGAGVLRFGLDGAWLRQDPASPHPRSGAALSSAVPLDANHNPQGARLDERRHTLDGSYEHRFLSGTWASTVSFSRSQQELLRGFLIDSSATAPNAHGFRETVPTTDIYFDSHLALFPAKGVEVVAGVDHLHGRGSARGGDFDYFVDLDGSGAPGGSDLPSQSAVRIRDRREFSGLYGQIEWSPLDRWHFEAGARLNRTAETRFTDALEFSSGVRDTGEDRRATLRFGGFAGFTWTAWRHGDDALRLYANYRNTFKPAAIDFGLDAEPDILAPETAESYEGGLKSHLLGDRLGLELSAFRMDMANVVVSQSVGGVPALVNAGAERFRGLEMSAAVRLRPDLWWRTAYSLHDARFRDFLTEFDGVPIQLAGNRLEMSARHMTSTELVIARPRGWQGTVRAGWVGSRFLNKRNTVLAPDYLTWSAGVGYRVRNVEIRLDGTNLNNQRPPVAESELGDAQYYRLPARRLELSARFMLGGTSP